MSIVLLTNGDQESLHEVVALLEVLSKVYDIFEEENVGRVRKDEFYDVRWSWGSRLLPLIILRCSGVMSPLFFMLAAMNKIFPSESSNWMSCSSSFSMIRVILGGIAGKAIN